MLAEFAITPDALRAKSYGDSELAQVCLSRLYEYLRSEAVTRDIGGRWQEALEAELGKYHPSGREIIEYLLKHKCIVADEFVQPWNVGSDRDWLALAEESHRKRALDLIVTRLLQRNDLRGAPLVNIASLENSAWGKSRHRRNEVDPSLDWLFSRLAFDRYYLQQT